jgi:hypothetical protein
MKQWYVDFECWVVEAETEAEAIVKAEEMRANGTRPGISSIEKCDFGDSQKEYPRRPRVEIIT